MTLAGVQVVVSGYPPLVEFLVGALVVLGLLAIVTRFIGRDASGRVTLPRIVDESIGMWALRRMTGRRLWERPPADDRPASGAGFDPNAADAKRAALGAMATANAADRSSMPTGPVPFPEVVAVRPGMPRLGRKPMIASAAMVSRTPVGDMRRRQLARRKRSRRPSPMATIGSVAAIVAVTAVALSFAGVSIVPFGQAAGSVVPSAAPSADNGAGGGPASGSPAANPAPRSSSPDPSASVQANRVRNATAPVARIDGLTTVAITGSTRRRVTITWSFSGTVLGFQSQVLQRRTDGGSWITIALASATTRSASFSLTKGHLYTFRVRAMDRLGTTGQYVGRSIRI